MYDKTQNAGDQKPIPSCQWDDQEILTHLENQVKKPQIELPIGTKIYTLQNPQYRFAHISDVAEQFAQRLYDDIRQDSNDIEKIAKNV